MITKTKLFILIPAIILVFPSSYDDSLQHISESIKARPVFSLQTNMFRQFSL